MAGEYIGDNCGDGTCRSEAGFEAKVGNMYRDIEELPMQRRAFERREVGLPVQYKALQEARATLNGTLTVDIGGGGLRILSEEFLPVASKVKVYISRTPGNEPIEAVC